MVTQARFVATSSTASPGQAQDLRQQADRDIATTVDQINTRLDAIAKLNFEIARAKATGQTTADLEDQRDQAIGMLSQQMTSAISPAIPARRWSMRRAASPGG